MHCWPAAVLPCATLCWRLTILQLWHHQRVDRDVCKPQQHGSVSELRLEDQHEMVGAGGAVRESDAVLVATQCQHVAHRHRVEAEHERLIAAVSVEAVSIEPCRTAASNNEMAECERLISSVSAECCAMMLLVVLSVCDVMLAIAAWLKSCCWKLSPLRSQLIRHTLAERRFSRSLHSSARQPNS